MEAAVVSLDVYDDITPPDGRVNAASRKETPGP